MAEQPAGAQGAAPLRPGPAGDDDRSESGGDTGAANGDRDGAHPTGPPVPGDPGGSEPHPGQPGGPGPVPGHPDHPGGPASFSGYPGSGPIPGYPDYLPYPWHPPRPRVVVRADLVPAVSVLSTVALLGFAVAWLWSVLAPPVRMVIGNDGQPFPLAAESYHRADGLVIFVLLGLAAGLCSGVGTWFLRERRGPVVMVAAVLGSVLGGWLATALGTAWAEGRYPAPGEVRTLDVVEMAPRLESMWVLLAWPLTTALAYGVLAAWNSMDDLGRRLG